MSRSGERSRGLAPTAWMFVCRNQDGKHPTRVESGPTKALLGNEFVEYLLLHDVRIERQYNEDGSGAGVKLFPEINSFHILDEPEDAWVMGVLGTKMMQVSPLIRIERPCRACRAKGIRS